MREDGLIGAELYTALMQDLDARQAAAEQRPPLLPPFRRTLRRLALDNFGRLRATSTTRAPDEILKAAVEEHADLIVMSTHGRSGLSKMLIGSVTEQVLSTAQIDVLAIPPHRTE